MTTPEITQLIGQGGMIVGLVWAVRYLTSRNEELLRDLITAHKETLAKNTEVLLRVELAMQSCVALQARETDTAHFRRPKPAIPESA